MRIRFILPMPPTADRRGLIQRLKGSRRRDEVVRLIQSLEPLRDEWEYAQVLQALGEVRDAERARALLREMPRRGVRPSIFCYNACIKAVGRAGEWRESLKLLDEMAAERIAPSNHSFSAALSALDKAGECDRALRLLGKIDKPDGFCFSPVIHALGNAGRPDEALRLLEEVLTKGFPERDLIGCFNSALHALATAGRLAEAEGILMRMRRYRVPPTHLSFGAVINAAAKACDWKAATRILQSMGQEQPPVSPNTECFNACLNALERCGQSEKALKMLEEMDACGQAPADTISFNTVIAALAREGAWQRALQLLETMQTRSQSGGGARSAGPSQRRPTDVQPNTTTYNTILNALEKGGQPDKAVELLGLMGGRCPADSYSYSSCIIALAKAGRSDEALQLLSQMETRGIKSDISPYNAAITALERAGRWREALQFLHARMTRRGFSPDVGSFTAAMQAVVGAGEIQEGFKLLKQVHAAPGVAKQSYQLHQMLMQACRAADDTHGANAVRAAMVLHGLEALDPRATATVDGREVGYVHGSESTGVVESTRALGEALLAHTPYVPQFHAVPFEQARRHGEDEQRDTLWMHPEKKALAELLKATAASDGAARTAELVVHVNFKPCADCHEWYKAASLHCGSRIVLREPRLVHRFERGECSCGDTWNWEERRRQSKMKEEGQGSRSDLPKTRGAPEAAASEGPKAGSSNKRRRDDAEPEPSPVVAAASHAEASERSDAVMSLREQVRDVVTTFALGGGELKSAFDESSLPWDESLARVLVDIAIDVITGSLEARGQRRYVLRRGDPQLDSQRVKSLRKYLHKLVAQRAGVTG